MSKYTIEIRFICEEACGLNQSVGYKGVEEIIHKAAPKIFDFNYPIFDENYRRALEEKILLHFYTREICEETIGLWKLRLMSKMREIMPYYNQMYESTLLKFDPFTDIDYTLTHKGRANESKKAETKTKHTSDTDFNENVKTDNETTFNENIRDLNTSHRDDINNTKKNDTTDHTEDSVINEITETKTHTSDNKITTQDIKEDRALTKNVTINDTEKTNIADYEISKTLTNKIGDNTTTLQKDGHNVDTVDIDETTVRTPDLNTLEKTDNINDDTGTGFDARNIQRSEDTVTKQTESAIENAKGVKQSSDSTLDLHSDTPQGNLIEIDDGTGVGVIDGYTLRERIDSRYLSDARDLNTVHNENNSQDIGKKDELENTKNFDETTDDNVTYTRNYRQKLDGTKNIDETGTETTDKTGHDVTQHDIDETHTTHELIDETTTTDFSDTKTSDKNFNKVETDNTTENEHNEEKLTKNESETIDTTTNFTRNQNENDTEHIDNNVNVDYTGAVDSEENYTRDKNNNTVYDGKKDTTNRTELLEKIFDDMQHNIRNTDEYINHAVGKISDISKSKMLLEFRETFLNIDEMIIEELNDLFFMLY